MKLNHLNLTVADVSATREFLEKYFGLRSQGKKGGNTLAVLFDDDGLVLTLIKVSQVTEVHYPDSFHIGFIQESPEQVNEINKRLTDDGFDVEPPHKAHGAWTFYFRAPGGFTIEVLC
ncbi:MAG: VOC family protein [Gemmataceae bacterium]|nr:VOC family protein [Gemmataceae bacterium]